MKAKIKKPTKKVTKEVVIVKKISKVAKLHLLGVVILLALIGGCFYKFGVVATVNGKPIYRLAYLMELQKSDTTVLNSMVQDSLILGEAKNKGITIEQTSVDDSVKTIEDQVKAQGMTLEDALKSEGMTRDQLEKQIRAQLIAEKLASPSADPTQAEIDDYLKTNKDYLSTTATKEELQETAKKALKSQAENTAINTWYSNLKAAAKIIYK